MRRFDSINIVPLIDVILVLLVITLTTATFIAQGILPITPPSAQNSQQQKMERTVEIRVDRDGKIALDNKIVTLDALKSELNMLDKNGSVSILADRESKFSSFVDVLDLLKGSGFETLNIVSNRDKK